MSSPEGRIREERFRDVAAARGLFPVGRNFVDRTLRQIAAFFSDSLFREETARRNGLLQRVDPRARLAATSIFLLSVSLAKPLPTLAAHAALPLAAVVLSRIRFREFLGAGFFAAVLFSLAMAAPAALNVVREGEIVVPLVRLRAGWSFGPLLLPATIGVTRQGLLSAATFLLRVLPSAAAVLWLTLSTRWVDLLRALRFFRLPPVFLQVAGMTVRYVHVLLRLSEETHFGKKSRSVCRMPASADRRWAGSRIAASWERSLHLVEEVGQAMAARGFRGDARFSPGPWFGAAEWALLLSVAVSCAGAHFVR